MPHSFNYLWVLICFALNPLGIMAQNNSGCYNPEFYYFDNDGDGYGNQKYTQSMKDDLIHNYYNNSNVGYVFGSHMLYCCMYIVLADYQVSYVEEFVDNDDEPCITNIYPQMYYRDADGEDLILSTKYRLAITHELFKILKGVNYTVNNSLQIRASVILHWLKRYNNRELQYRQGMATFVPNAISKTILRACRRSLNHCIQWGKECFFFS